ncbi:MAG: hypothetical protein Q7I99_08700 [Acholeplasmataceae bacterium]|nr:hypothetical protein [Acholeplasmataceae bacterium]
MQNQQTSRFPKFQNLFFKITWILLILSVVLFGIGYLLVQVVVAAPMILTQFAMFVLYYHAFHFLCGIFGLFYYLIKVDKKMTKTKIYKTLIGIVVSPFSAFAAYMAVFLLVVSSCSSN